MRIGNIEIRRVPKSQETKQEINKANSANGSVTIRNGIGYSSNNYSPSSWDLSVYRTIRQTIPFVDMAVIQLAMLVGDFMVECENESDQARADEFLKRVRSNYISQGVSNWWRQLVDSTLWLGMGIGEIWPEADHVVNGIAENIRFIKDSGEMVLGYKEPGTTKTMVVDPLTSYYSALNQKDGSPTGYSIFYSCPFVSQMYSMLQESLYNTIWRFGDPSIVSIVMGDPNNPENEDPKVLSGVIKSNMADVYQSRMKGQVKDMHLYSPGNFTVKFQALGADGRQQQFDFHFPSRFLIENIITVTLLPPYRFGLYDWNSNYRMSTDQAEALKSNIKRYRDSMENIADKLMWYFFSVQRRTGARFKITWQDIDWTDSKEKAETGKLEAEALAVYSETIISLWQNGLISEDEAYDSLVGIGLIGKKTSRAKFAENLAKYRKIVLIGKAAAELTGAKRLKQIRGLGDE